MVYERTKSCLLVIASFPLYIRIIHAIPPQSASRGFRMDVQVPLQEKKKKSGLSSGFLGAANHPQAVSNADIAGNRPALLYM